MVRLHRVRASVVLCTGDDHPALYLCGNQHRSCKELGCARADLLGCDVRIQLSGAGPSRDRVRSAGILHLWYHSVFRDNVSGSKGIEQQFGICGRGAGVFESCYSAKMRTWRNSPS